MIQEPTRITKNSATVIDNIFCNSKTTLESSGAIIYDISDHLPIFTVTNAGKRKDVVDDYMDIQIGLSEKDMDLIEQRIDVTELECITKIRDVNEAYDKMITLLEKNIKGIGKKS